VFGRQRQKDQKLKTILGYISKILSQKKKKMSSGRIAPGFVPDLGRDTKCQQIGLAEWLKQ
jgi:hypothetical protein